MKKLILFLSAFMLIVGSMTAQHTPKSLGLNAITQGTIEGQLEFLASDWTLGRETGTEGAYMAADYIASMFKVWGLTPGGDTPRRQMGRGFRGGGTTPPQRTYFQNFNLIEYWPGDEQEVSIISTTDNKSQSMSFNYLSDFSINVGPYGIATEAEIVFAGYGLKNADNNYDDFKGLELKDKWVVVLNGFPGHLDKDSKAFELFSQISKPRSRDKYPWARDAGALGVIEVVSEGNKANWTTNKISNSERSGPAPTRRTRMTRSDKKTNGGYLVLSVTSRFLDELADGQSFTFDNLENEIAKTRKPASRSLLKKSIAIKTTVNSRSLTARNVVGVLEGKDTENVIVIGGHYDHLGERDGWIYNGADDNASGTVGVMTIAKAMAATGEKPEKTIVFCAWTGEEKGLIGSSVFADEHYDWNILCNLNFDMISRNSRGEDQDKKISMTFTNTLPILKELTEKHNSEYNLDMDVSYKGSEQPGGGSDHAPFARKGIPVFYFMAGFPPEYHQTNDHLSLIKWDKMLSIVKLGYLNIYELANMKWE